MKSKLLLPLIFLSFGLVAQSALAWPSFFSRHNKSNVSEMSSRQDGAGSFIEAIELIEKFNQTNSSQQKKETVSQFSYYAASLGSFAASALYAMKSLAVKGFKAIPALVKKSVSFLLSGLSNFESSKLNHLIKIGSLLGLGLNHKHIQESPQVKMILFAIAAAKVLRTVAG